MNWTLLFTDQLSEKPLVQLSVVKAEKVLLWRRAGDGPHLGVTLPVSRQTNDVHSYVVVFGVCGSSDGARAAWVIHSVRQQQGDTHTAARRLLIKELRGVRDGVGQICAVTDVGHGRHTALEDIQILPVAEVVLHGDGAAVLQCCQAQTDAPGDAQRRQPGAETLNEAALLLKQEILGILRAVYQEGHLHQTHQSWRGNRKW